VSVCAQRHAKSAGKTEIGEFEVTLLVDQKVLWLEITVKDAVGMAVLDTVAKLVHEFANNHVAETKMLQVR
jgi:hypothetical protein